MKPLFLLLLAVTVLYACHGPAGHGYIPLTLSSIYSPDSVRLAMDGGDEKAAEKKLGMAIGQYRKNNDTLGSVQTFKQAILLKPTAKGYFELSGALLATRQYPEAILALRIAEKLGYTPLANVMFRYSYAFACLMNYNYRLNSGYDHVDDSAYRYMELAIQMGYAHPQEYLKKEYFPYLSSDVNFMRTFSDVLSGTTGRSPEKSLFESYAAQFPEVSLPLVVNMEWIKGHQLEDQISFEFEKFIPDMRNANFDRDGGEVYYYIALVRKDPVYTAVLYAQQYDGDQVEEGAAKTLTPVFQLVTYDPRGRIIDKMQVAGRNDLDAPFKAFSIREDLHFQVQDFTDDYKEDPEKAARDSSQYLGLKAQTPENYLIDAMGKFVKTDAPLAVR